MLEQTGCLAQLHDSGVVFNGIGKAAEQQMCHNGVGNIGELVFQSRQHTLHQLVGNVKALSSGCLLLVLVGADGLVEALDEVGQQFCIHALLLQEG